MEAPRVVEKQVPILTPQEIVRLRQTAAHYRNGSCAAAVGMMLYAGIRPHEVARLTWAQVDTPCDSGTQETQAVLGARQKQLYATRVPKFEY